MCSGISVPPATPAHSPSAIGRATGSSAASPPCAGYASIRRASTSASSTFDGRAATFACAARSNRPLLRPRRPAPRHRARERVPDASLVTVR
jgi:hypothetical protein